MEQLLYNTSDHCFFHGVSTTVQQTITQVIILSFTQTDFTMLLKLGNLSWVEHTSALTMLEEIKTNNIPIVMTSPVHVLPKMDKSQI